jgi:hypothetical protein
MRGAWDLLRRQKKSNGEEFDSSKSQIYVNFFSDSTSGFLPSLAFPFIYSLN